MRILLSLIYTCFVLSTPILCAIVILPTFYLPKGMKFRIYQRLVKVYSNALIMLGSLRVNVTGLNNIPSSGAAILISNHSSLIDSFIMISAVSRQIHIFTGLMLFRVPFLSYFLRACGFLPIYFRQPFLSADSLNKAVKFLNNGELMLTFASKVTSVEEHIGKIQPGFFEMCERSNVMIIPVAIKGSKAFLTGKRLLMVTPGKVSVNIGNEIDFNAMIKAEGGAKAEIALRRIIHSLYQEI